MLYSALILKTDANHDGYIDQAELDALLNPIGASSSKEDFVIPQPRRKIPVNDLLAQAGLPEPLETRYAALSANGYALSRAEGQTLGKSR